MELKIYIDVSIQEERFKILMEYTKKYKILNKYDITIVDKYINSDLILFLINSRYNLINLGNDYQYIFETKIPIILLERVDSSLTWVREFDKIKNLKAVFKNRKLRNIKLQNTDKTYYGKYQYYLIQQSFNLNNLVSENATDVGIEYYPKNKKLKEILNEDLNKINCVLWDFHSSPLCQKLSMSYFRNNPIDFNKNIDIFCVNQVKTNNFVNIPREKAKNIVNSLKNKFKVITDKLKPDEYEKIFSKSKIAIACWGFGEWVHMDAYALNAGVILIKPDTDYVKMYPDIYKSNETYIKCKHDYSDLKEILINILNNYNDYLPMIKNNKKFISKFNEENTANLFWKKIKNIMTE